MLTVTNKIFVNNKFLQIVNILQYIHKTNIDRYEYKNFNYFVSISFFFILQTLIAYM